MNSDPTKTILDGLVAHVVNKLSSVSNQPNISNLIPNFEFRTFSIAKNLSLAYNWAINLVGENAQLKNLPYYFMNFVNDDSLLTLSASKYYPKVN